MSNQLALLFSGQGAQHVGMGKELFADNEPARQVFQKAEEVLGEPLGKICFEGPEATLTETRWAQPAIFVHSLAAHAALKASQPGLLFHASAGLSLGEFTALTAAGWISFEDGLRLVRKRGELMQRSCETTQGGMASVLGMEAGPLEEICRQAGVDLANLNCPGQIVISGEKSAIDRAVALAKEKGAKRAIPLTVAGAYHSRLMQSAADELRLYLEGVAINPTATPVISNVTAQPHSSDPAKVKELLVKQVTSPVRWEDSIRHLVAQGFQDFIELGPGDVLAGLMKRIQREAKMVSISKPADLEKLSAFAAA
jgi:[acyl-carrier-protein] S-malonyltransferase